MTFESLKKAGIIAGTVIGCLGSMSGLMYGLDTHITKEVNFKIDRVMQTMDMRYWNIRIEVLQDKIERLKSELTRDPNNAQKRGELSRAYQQLDEAKMQLDTALGVR